MPIEIEIATNQKALDYIADSDFIQSWLELAQTDEKDTINLEPSFVVPWYKSYSSVYSPALVMAFDESRNLVGIIPLAVTLTKREVIHAGALQAEYHGWICKPEIENEFPVKALIKIKDELHPKIWEWRCMPPGSPINWFSSRRLHQKHIYVRHQYTDSPILDLHNQKKINRLLKNRSFKIKLNRYIKRGNLLLERIKSREKAERIFDTLANQCDFRQGATNNSRPFQDDDHKKAFYLEKLSFPEKCHFVVLWLDDKPIAYHFADSNDETVYLGLSGYDPVESSNSPGTILLIKLIELLKKEGYKSFDLTPGGSYKERYCSHHQPIYTPTIYFSDKDIFVEHLKTSVKSIIKHMIKKMGMTPKEILAKFEMTSKKIKRFKSPSKTRVPNYYLLSKDAISGPGKYNGRVNVQKYEDLLLYQDSVPGLKKNDFLSQSLSNFAAGDTLYSIVENGILLHCGWMATGGKNTRFENANYSFSDYPETAILYDFHTFTKKEGRNLLEENISTMLTYLQEVNIQSVYVQE